MTSPPLTPLAPAYAAPLAGNLLDEQLLHYRSIHAGERIAATLPELFVAMAQDTVRDFPALRPHQRHPWHAFLVQLAAIALHQAGRNEPFATAGEWRSALLTLTPDDPDGAAWCLVSPVNRPAFMQAPVLAGLDAKWELSSAVDELDVLKTSKNHDLKTRRMICASDEDWAFVLVSIQTQSPSDSGSYKESSRMDGGWGRRPGIGVVPPGYWGARWHRDLKILLIERNRTVETYGFDRAGLALLWLQPWDGLAHSAFQVFQLDPFYIEVTRRIRLLKSPEGIVAKTTTTPNARISSINGGLTGDIWSPIDSDKDGKKVLTLRTNGFDYKTAADLVFPASYEFSHAMQIQRGDQLEGLKMLMQSIAWGPKNTNHGYHERHVAIGKKMATLLAAKKTSEVAQIGEISKSRVQVVGEINWMLIKSLIVLFSKEAQTDISKKDPDGIKRNARDFAAPFEAQCDATFFPELIEEIEAEADTREAIRSRWLLTLADRAEQVLRTAFVAGPRSSHLRYRAQATALARLRGAMYGSPKYPAKLPALAAALKQRQALPTEETHEPD